MSLLCESIADFRAYDTKKIAVSIGRSKGRAGGRSRVGVWAYVVPLRTHSHTGRVRLVSTDLEQDFPDALYQMCFMFPRFGVLSAKERVETVVHELYHIHPSLNGELRTFAGAHRHHGPTPRAYNLKVSQLTAEALESLPWLEQHPLLLMKQDEFEARDARRLRTPDKAVHLPPRWVLS
jgi:hypothetical protein